MFLKDELINSIKEVFEELVLLDNFTISTDNGPYKDKELPVRFNCHLLIIGSFLIRNGLIERERLSELEKFVSNMIENDSKFNYKFRESNFTKRDTVNGTMGPAWVAESLLYAGDALGRQDFTDEARRLLNCHVFDETNRCWHRLTPCGMLLPIDYTFNHQLWFAEQCLKTYEPDLIDQASSFLEYQIPKLILLRNGIIHHYTPIIKFLKKPTIGHLTDLYYSYGQFLLSGAYQKDKSVAYQGFNLKALAGCFKLAPQLKCWSSNKFKKLTKFEYTAEINCKLSANAYGYQYNPSVYEFLFWFKTCNPCRFDYVKSFIEKERIIHNNLQPRETTIQKLRIYEVISYLESDD